MGDVDHVLAAGDPLARTGIRAKIVEARAELGNVLGLLSPAEAYAAFDHPNLLACREHFGHEIVAIFIR